MYKSQAFFLIVSPSPLPLFLIVPPSHLPSLLSVPPLICMPSCLSCPPLPLLLSFPPPAHPPPPPPPLPSLDSCSPPAFTPFLPISCSPPSLLLPCLHSTPSHPAPPSLISCLPSPSPLHQIVVDLQVWPGIMLLILILPPVALSSVVAKLSCV